MRKTFIFIFTIFSILFSTAYSVCAGTTPLVSFDGDAQRFISSADASHFGDAFTGIAPGESKTQDFTIQNPTNNLLQVYFSATALKDLLEEGSALYFVSLEQNGKTIYSGSLGGQNGSLTDLHITDLNGASPFLLTALAPGESTKFSLTVKLDGATAGNEYQNKQGLFQFTFSAAIIAAETPRPISTPSATHSQALNVQTKAAAPTLSRSTGSKTMDKSDLRGFYTLLALSLIGFFAVNWDILFHKKRGRRNKS